MTNISSLIELMERLRDPKHGCPWDRTQTFASLASYTVEEAYEVADAVTRDDMADLVSELGDLLFHVIFYAQIAKEAGLFDFEEVVAGIVEKMTRRHPHVFAGEKAGNIAALTAAWEAHKATERKKPETSLMDQVTRGLPAIRRAIKLQKKAAQVEFNRAETLSVTERLREGIRRIEDKIHADNHGDARTEIGDILFTSVNLARHLHVDPDRALRETNTEFEHQFRLMEKILRSQGKSIDTSSPEELDSLRKQITSKQEK
uniref:ATP diphosphatase n=1 Tax=Candidatus Kentrum sp. SD TaxID=2126332 RepID=A0A451BJZ9_9GAMM|nr:MAG: ATP diphosphatase [Candidatus Kentron sp. SD]